MSTENTQDYEPYDGLLYTKPQTAAVELISYFTAPLSVVGSSMILWLMWSSRHDPLQQTPYHRLILGLSILDLISSLSFVVLGSWVVPEFIKFTLYGRGTFRTCEISGFFINFMFGAMWYSCFLSIYFFFLVCLEWKEDTMAHALEPVTHAVSNLYPLVTGIYGLSADLFNPLRQVPGTCWFADYPPYCSTADDSPDCIRGGSYVPFAQASQTYGLAVVLLVIVISMISIVVKVRQTELKLRVYSVGGSGRHALSRTRETACQAMLYIGSFFAVFFPIIMLNWTFEAEDPEKNTTVVFVFALLTKAITPMQGFFNAYIYVHKRFWKLTAEGKSFVFMRKLPLLGRWIVRLSDRHNNINNHETPVQRDATTRNQTVHAETLPPRDEASVSVEHKKSEELLS